VATSAVTMVVVTGVAARAVISKFQTHVDGASLDDFRDIAQARLAADAKWPSLSVRANVRLAEQRKPTANSQVICESSPDNSHCSAARGNTGDHRELSKVRGNIGASFT
jgi:hypothetical protein